MSRKQGAGRKTEARSEPTAADRELGRRIEEAVAAARMHPDEFCARVINPRTDKPFSNASYYRWIYGKRLPSRATLAQIALVTGRPLEWFVEPYGLTTNGQKPVDDGDSEERKNSKAVTDAVRQIIIRFAFGENLASAFERVYPDLLEDWEQNLFHAQSEELRNYLIQAAGPDWHSLSPDQQAEELARIFESARRRRGRSR